MREEPETRSRIMRTVKGENTTPELTVRRLVFCLGYRYRLHRKDLPGKPDLVFAGRRKLIFIHGCFWHGHDCKRGARIPKNNRDYWEQKIARNRQRDAQHCAALKDAGWSILVIWECQLREREELTRQVKLFMEGN